MNQKKNSWLGCLAGSLCCLLLLAGCAPEGGGAGQSQVKEDYEIDNSSISRMLETTPKTIQTELGQNLEVDATVTVPQVESMPKFQAKLMDFDDQALANDFWQGQPPEKKVEQGTDFPVSIYQDEQSNLMVSTGIFNYSQEQSKYYEIPLWSAIQYNRFSAIYGKEQLDFLDKQQAVDQVTAWLKRQGITEFYGQPEIYAIDAETMQREQDTALQNDDGGWKDYMDIGKTIKKDTFTKEDEFYRMSFRLGYAGAPMSKEAYTTENSERMVMGSEIRVYYGQSGIMDCAVHNVYGEKTVLEMPERLLTVEEAMEKLQQRYDQVLSAGKMRINAISLEYVGKPASNQEDEMTFVPAWRFSLLDKERENMEDYRSWSSIQVDAMTGEIF